jgi:hypothetical protein
VGLLLLIVLGVLALAALTAGVVLLAARRDRDREEVDVSGRPAAGDTTRSLPTGRQALPESDPGERRNRLAKESMQPRRRVRPPTARELDPARGDVASAVRSGYDLRLAWVRGRHDTGATCPSCNLARETVTRSLVTRAGPGSA